MTLDYTPFWALAQGGSRNGPGLRGSQVSVSHERKTMIKCNKSALYQSREGSTKKKQRLLNVLSRLCASLVEAKRRSKALWRYDVNLSNCRLSLSIYLPLSLFHTHNYSVLFVIKKRVYISMNKCYFSFNTQDGFKSLSRSYVRFLTNILGKGINTLSLHL